MSNSLHVDLEHDLDLVVERLHHEFDDVESSVIDEVVHAEAARFEAAPVQNFVSLLAEKAAKHSLRKSK
jgi:hypothetical protein